MEDSKTTCDMTAAVDHYVWASYGTSTCLLHLHAMNLQRSTYLRAAVEQPSPPPPHMLRIGSSWVTKHDLVVCPQRLTSPPHQMPVLVVW